MVLVVRVNIFSVRTSINLSVIDYRKQMLIFPPKRLSN